MSRKAAFLVWLILTGMLSAAILFCTNLAPFLILEAIESLPVIIYSGIFSFAFIDILVPNPRIEGSSGLTWLYWESMEHLAFPLLLLGLSSAFSAYPIIFQLSIVSVMIGLYGFCFGEIRKERDLLKILLLVNLLLALWWLPTAVMWIDYAWGIKGILTWSLLSAATILTYKKAKGSMIRHER
jgi:hypothetical protein